MAFNRTIVELKDSRRCERRVFTYAFNRTIVELKARKETVTDEDGTQTFNRTIVELKEF